MLTEIASKRDSRLIHDRAPRGQEPTHVLLIEDDIAISEMYRIQLEYDGYRVTIATTGHGGFDAVTTASPDIVLLDLLLPDRSGLEIMAEIKAHETSMIEITGLIKKGQYGPDGVGIGNGVRLTPGPSSPGGGGIGNPNFSQTIIDVEGWRPVVGSCPR